MDYSFLAKRTILVLLVLGWCFVIFSFSAEDADESKETSEGFISAVCQLIVPEFDDFKGAEREEFIEKLQFGVRKAAHFTAYAILGFLSWLALYGIKRGRRYLFSVGFSFLYACSDEIHQLFVSGRSGQFRDVLIDTGGAMSGALAGLGIMVLAERFRAQRKKAVT